MFEPSGRWILGRKNNPGRVAYRLEMHVEKELLVVPRACAWPPGRTDRFVPG